MEAFAATTADTVVAVGSWRYRGTLYQDKLLRFVIDVPGAFTADGFFRSYKETLKSRFDQIDIWITSHEIQIL